MTGGARRNEHYGRACIVVFDEDWLPLSLSNQTLSERKQAQNSAEGPL